MCIITYIRCDVKTMSYIVFISYSLHWSCIKIALKECYKKVILIKGFERKNIFFQNPQMSNF